MGDFKITFGDAAANRTISDDELKTVSQKTSLDEEKQQSIFTKAFDKNDDGIINESELSEGLRILKKSAAADGHTDNLSDDEARAFLAQHNIEDARVEDLYGFFNKAKEVYAEHAAQDEKKAGEGAEEQPTVQAEEQEEEPAEEHAEEAPVDKGKVYAKNGETFDQTAKRLGFEKGTEEYNEFVKANPQAAKKHWFRLGVEINIPESLKDKVKDEAYGVDRKAEEAKYKEAVKTKKPPKASGTSGTERTEDAVTPPASKKSAGKKDVSKANLKESDLKGVFYDPKTKTHYIEQAGKMVEWRPREEMVDGEKVVQANADGSYVTQCKNADGIVCRWTYNKKGQKTGWVGGKSSQKFEASGEYEINDLAHPGKVKQRKDEYGKVHVFKNNADGSYEHSVYDSSGNFVAVYAVNKDGYAVLEKCADGRKFVYNKDKNTVIMPDGTIEDISDNTTIHRGYAYYHRNRDRKDGLIESRQKGVYYDPQTKYHFSNEDGEWAYWKPSSEMTEGETVVHVHSDGSFVTEWRNGLGIINRSYYNRQGKETKKVRGKSTEKFVRAKLQF